VAERARDLIEGLVRERPDDPAYHVVASEVWTQVAKNRWRRPDRAGLRAALLRAVEEARAATELDPGSPEHRDLLDNRRTRLGRFDSEVAASGGRPSS
jgi:hypothetical protein